MQAAAKPKLVLFHWLRPELPHYVRLHLQQRIKCLSLSFEVVTVGEACDYAEICDRHQPDIALFESGVYAGERRISNTASHPQVPKIGLLDSDAYCLTRSTFISDMDHWGIDTFFSTSVAMAEYTPAIAGKLFVWPNCIDGEIYRDYGQPKPIPVLITGSHAPHYPWRSEISRIVAQYYPSLTCPHFGWFSERKASRMLHGEAYAKLINSSWIVPTCGTIAKELVRKHFEIPACGACLVTERTASIEAAGFEDMKNCVFADATDIIDKLDHLFQHRDELEAIIRSGHDTVHRRHTIRERNQIHQWFLLHRSLGPGQKIIQANAFEPLRIADNSLQQANTHIVSGGIDRVLIEQADEKLWAGDYDEAERLYSRCLNYHFIPEANLRLALCKLYRGDAATALELVSSPITTALENYRARDPDPVEWAYFIIALVCNNDLAHAGRRAREFSWLHHSELDRARAVVHYLTHDRRPPAELLHSRPACRASIHRFPERSFELWVAEMVRIFLACGRFLAAERLRRLQLLAAADGRTRDLPLPMVEAVEPPHQPAALPLVSASFLSRLQKRIGSKLGALAGGLHSEHPDQAAHRHKEFLAAIEGLARWHRMDNVLLVLGPSWTRQAQAIVAGLGKNPGNPRAFCIGEGSAGIGNAGDPRARPSWLEICGLSARRLKERLRIDAFDIVLLDAHAADADFEFDDIAGAENIVLVDIDDFSRHRIYRRLIDEYDYALCERYEAASWKHVILRRPPAFQGAARPADLFLAPSSQESQHGYSTLHRPDPHVQFRQDLA